MSEFASARVTFNVEGTRYKKYITRIFIIVYPSSFERSVQTEIFHRGHLNARVRLAAAIRTPVGALKLRHQHTSKNSGEKRFTAE